MTRAAMPPSPSPAPGANVVTPSSPRRGSGDAIDQWLVVFTRFLSLPHAQSTAIKDELDSHLRERVRDLMLEGLNEDEGMRRAIDELGEAAELAAHFRAVHRPNWRTYMSIAAIGVAASAAVVSIVALSQASGNAQPSVPVLQDLPLMGSLFKKGEPAAPAQPAVTTTLKMESPRVVDLLEAAVKGTGRPCVVRLPQQLAEQQFPGTANFVDADLHAVLRQINSAMELKAGDRIDVRSRGSVIEFARAEVFDAMERVLVSYDLSHVFRNNAASTEIVSAITTFVESEGWVENGGVTARLMVVGNKLFVDAPPRYQEGVAWILGQFASPRAASAAGASGLGIASSAPSPLAASGAGGAAEAQQRDSMLQRKAWLQRELAWNKVRLGLELTDEERPLLDDRQVKTLDVDAAARAEVMALMAAHRAEIERLEAAMSRHLSGRGGGSSNGGSTAGGVGSGGSGMVAPVASGGAK